MNLKHVFNEVYASYIGRSWLYAPDRSDKEISLFMQSQRVVIVKPVDLFGGEGIYKISFDEILDMTAFCQEVRNRRCLLEEVIIQHETMAAINPHSVNTIRIITLLDRGGELRYLGAMLRCAAGEQIVDNKTAGGIRVMVDMDTGILLSKSADAQLNPVIRHPYSNTVLPGIQVPFWKEVMKLVSEAAMVTPSLRLIGWDVAITETGPLLIEANTMPGLVSMQWGNPFACELIKKYL